MKRCKRALAFTVGLLVGSAVPLCAGGAAYETAVNADAARKMSMLRAQDLQGDAKALERHFLPPAEGTAGSRSPTPRDTWIVPDVERVPDNLASNGSR